MSYLNIKKALVSQLESVAGAIPIANENTEFDPKGLDVFLSAYFNPVNETTLGKTQESGDWSRGFFQVSIFIKQNDDKLDELSLTTLNSVMTSFRNGTSVTSGATEVFIQESTLNGGYTVDGWFKRDLTVYWASILPR